MEEPLPTVLVSGSQAPGGWSPAPPPLPGPAQASFGVGVMLAQTFSVWGRNLLFFLPLGILSRLPAAVGTWVLYTTRPEVMGAVASNDFADALAAGRSPFAIIWERTLRSIVAFLPYSLVGLALTLLLMAAASHGAIRRLAGDRVGMGTSIGAALRAFPTILAVTLIAWLVSIPATLALVFPAVILALGWCAAIPVIVAERAGPLAALRRSWSLTLGYRWELLAGFLVLYLVLAFGGAIISTPLLFFAVRAGFTGEMSGASLATPSAIVQLLQGALHTLLLVAPAVAYHGLRLTKEGQDPEQLRRVFE